jgi:hypothetical protein
MLRPVRKGFGDDGLAHRRLARCSGAYRIVNGAVSPTLVEFQSSGVPAVLEGLYRNRFVALEDSACFYGSRSGDVCTWWLRHSIIGSDPSLAHIRDFALLPSVVSTPRREPWT